MGTLGPQYVRSTHIMAEGSGKTEIVNEGKHSEEKNKKEEVKQFSFNRKPEEKHGCEGFLHFLWNKETGEFLGRTGMSWLKITVFYIIYYSFLTVFFMLMLFAFFATLDDTKPSWDTESNGIIGKNPGLGFRPMPPDESIESTLVWFRHGDDNGNWMPWVERLEEHLEDYKNDTHYEHGSHSVECGPLGSKHPGTKGMCRIDQKELFRGPCTNENNYGFKQGKPCLLIKLNKIFKWEPEPYESAKDFPEDLPQTIRDAFTKNIEDGNEELNNRVWLECDGENPADRENIGKMTYYPTNGVSANFYPYLNQKGYLSPVVFAHLDNPRHGVLISVECKAWAKNIQHDSQERKGLVHFELMID